MKHSYSENEGFQFTLLPDRNGVYAVSIYDNREKPAYRGSSWELEYSSNPYILKWWTPVHDELIAMQITLATLLGPIVPPAVFTFDEVV